MTKQIPDWQYDEFQQLGIIDFDTIERVEEYAQIMAQFEFNQELVEKLGIQAGHTVVDMGSGTGAFVCPVAETGATVHAVDISQTMLDFAQKKADRLGVTNIQFHHTGFLTFELPSDSVDVIVSKFSLHHLPNFWQMIAIQRCAEMLKEGGLFYLHDIIYAFDSADYHEAIEAWFERIVKPKGEGYTRADFASHVRDEHSTFAWIIEGMLERAGFDIIDDGRTTPEYGAYLCRKR